MEPFYFSPGALCNHSFKDTDNDQSFDACIRKRAHADAADRPDTSSVKADPDYRRGIPGLLLLSGPMPC